MNDIIAIRSLLCEDHAINIPPRVLGVHWFLGKRCNFDCSYCSPHHHDAVSPFVDRSQALSFIQNCHRSADRNQKRIKWSFTGGEPFIDPSFFELVRTLGELTTTEQINVTTNGSLPLMLYQKFLPYLKGITFSLHLERDQQELDRIVQNIILLHQAQKCHVTVNLMVLPNHLNQVKLIGQQLNDSGVPYIARKITPAPAVQEHLLPFVGNKEHRKSVSLLDPDAQSQKKIIWKDLNDRSRSQLVDDYYNHQEQEFLNSANDKPIWQNMGMWKHDGSYQEINSDLLVARDQHSFQGWKCFAGTDYLFVDFDGSIWVASCFNGSSIGNIRDGNVTFLDQPVDCQRKWCLCNTEIAIRKARDTQALELINPISPLEKR